LERKLNNKGKFIKQLYCLGVYNLNAFCLTSLLKFISMKKHILSFALVATMVGSIAAGCSSTKSTDGSDSSKTDSTATVAPAATDSTSSKTDTTMKTDTAKKDTSKKTPM
jgi:hypothetical protein